MTLGVGELEQLLHVRVGRVGLHHERRVPAQDGQVLCGVARAVGEQGGEGARIEGGAPGEEQLGQLSLLQAARVARSAGRVVEPGEANDRGVLGDSRELMARTAGCRRWRS